MNGSVRWHRRDATIASKLGIYCHLSASGNLTASCAAGEEDSRNIMRLLGENPSPLCLDDPVWITENPLELESNPNSESPGRCLHPPTLRKNQNILQSEFSTYLSDTSRFLTQMEREKELLMEEVNRRIGVKTGAGPSPSQSSSSPGQFKSRAERACELASSNSAPSVWVGLMNIPSELLKGSGYSDDDDDCDDNETSKGDTDTADIESSIPSLTSTTSPDLKRWVISSWMDSVETSCKSSKSNRDSKVKALMLEPTRNMTFGSLLDSMTSDLTEPTAGKFCPSEVLEILRFVDSISPIVDCDGPDDGLFFFRMPLDPNTLHCSLVSGKSLPLSEFSQKFGTSINEEFIDRSPKSDRKSKGLSDTIAIPQDGAFRSSLARFLESCRESRVRFLENSHYDPGEGEGAGGDGSSNDDATYAAIDGLMWFKVISFGSTESILAVRKDVWLLWNSSWCSHSPSRSLVCDALTKHWRMASIEYKTVDRVRKFNVIRRILRYTTEFKETDSLQFSLYPDHPDFDRYCSDLFQLLDMWNVPGGANLEEALKKSYERPEEANMLASLVAFILVKKKHVVDLSVLRSLHDYLSGFDSMIPAFILSDGSRYSTRETKMEDERDYRDNVVNAKTNNEEDRKAYFDRLEKINKGNPQLLHVLSSLVGARTSEQQLDTFLDPNMVDMGAKVSKVPSEKLSKGKKFLRAVKRKGVTAGTKTKSENKSREGNIVDGDDSEEKPRQGVKRKYSTLDAYGSSSAGCWRINKKTRRYKNVVLESLLNSLRFVNNKCKRATKGSSGDVGNNNNLEDSGDVTSLSSLNSSLIDYSVEFADYATLPPQLQRELDFLGDADPKIKAKVEILVDILKKGELSPPERDMIHLWLDEGCLAHLNEEDLKMWWDSAIKLEMTEVKSAWTTAEDDHHHSNAIPKPLQELCDSRSKSSRGFWATQDSSAPLKKDDTITKEIFSLKMLKSKEKWLSLRGYKATKVLYAACLCEHIPLHFRKALFLAIGIVNEEEDYLRSSEKRYETSLTIPAANPPDAVSGKRYVYTTNVGQINKKGLYVSTSYTPMPFKPSSCHHNGTRANYQPGSKYLATIERIRKAHVDQIKAVLGGGSSSNIATADAGKSQRKRKNKNGNGTSSCNSGPPYEGWLWGDETIFGTIRERLESQCTIEPTATTIPDTIRKFFSFVEYAWNCDYKWRLDTGKPIHDLHKISLPNRPEFYYDPASDNRGPHDRYPGYKRKENIVTATRSDTNANTSPGETIITGTIRGSKRNLNGTLKDVGIMASFQLAPKADPKVNKEKVVEPKPNPKSTTNFPVNDPPGQFLRSEMSGDAYYLLFETSAQSEVEGLSLSTIRLQTMFTVHFRPGYRMIDRRNNGIKRYRKNIKATVIKNAKEEECKKHVKDSKLTSETEIQDADILEDGKGLQDFLMSLRILGTKFELWDEDRDFRDENRVLWVSRIIDREPELDMCDFG